MNVRSIWETKLGRWIRSKQKLGKGRKWGLIILITTAFLSWIPNKTTKGMSTTLRTRLRTTRSEHGSIAQH